MITQDTITINSGTTINSWLANINSNLVRTPGKLEFTLRNTDSDAKLTFSPQYQRYQDRYGIYFKLAGTAGGSVADSGMCAGAGGTSGAAGSGGRGGASGTAGRGGASGSGGASSGSGGATLGSGGVNGGTAGTAVNGVAGASGSGQAGGGRPGTGGAPAGGASGSIVGSGATAGLSGSAASHASAGCSCSLAGNQIGTPWTYGILTGLALLMTKRRRRRAARGASVARYPTSGEATRSRWR